jgi:deoxyribodipyrimidine photo-lyase
MSVIFWYRKDLRIQDNEALFAASVESKEIYPLFAHNAREFAALEGIRQHSLVESLRSLDNSLNNQLNIVEFNSTEELARKLAEACKETEVKTVYAMQRFDPQGVEEQVAVAKALEVNGLTLKLIGSAYAVIPGTVRKPDGTNYRVYTPFFNSWTQIADTSPFVLDITTITWKKFASSTSLPAATKPSPIKVIAGEAFATRTFERFKARAVTKYSEDRNRADLSGTSHLSHALAHGEIHPRTLLSQLGDDQGSFVFRKEIAWREFYADVLHHYPHTQTDYYEPRFKKLQYDTGKVADERFKAWCEGKTGYPMVDAGMRQLLAEGWMHNRVRMIVASFLVKDLHIEWTLGAEHFEKHLSDFDPASNAHGWQWTAGCGTDASPYYRIFNPVMQGLKFDPNGDYVRKYVEELRHLPGADAHEPWNVFSGYDLGYPVQIIDHAEERNESLSRLEALKNIS